MRELNIGTKQHTKVIAINDPGPGGACHNYSIVKTDAEDPLFRNFAHINFQKGLIKENGVNGCHHEDLIAIVKVLLGGEVQEYTNMINEARQFAVQKVMKNAVRLGADAVVGLKMGSTAQIVPGTAEIFVYGTAVTLKKPKKVKKRKK